MDVDETIDDPPQATDIIHASDKALKHYKIMCRAPNITEELKERIEKQVDHHIFNHTDTADEGPEQITAAVVRLDRDNKFLTLKAQGLQEQGDSAAQFTRYMASAAEKQLNLVTNSTLLLKGFDTFMNIAQCDKYVRYVLEKAGAAARDIRDISRTHPYTGRASRTTHVVFRNANKCKNVIFSKWKAAEDLEGITVEIGEGDLCAAMKKPMEMVLATRIGMGYEPDELVRCRGNPKSSRPEGISRIKQGSKALEHPKVELRQSTYPLEYRRNVDQNIVKEFRQLFRDTWERKYGRDHHDSFPVPLAIYPKDFGDARWDKNLWDPVRQTK